MEESRILELRTLSVNEAQKLQIISEAKTNFGIEELLKDAERIFQYFVKE